MKPRHPHAQQPVRFFVRIRSLFFLVLSCDWLPLLNLKNQSRSLICSLNSILFVGAPKMTNPFPKLPSCSSSFSATTIRCLLSGELPQPLYAEWRNVSSAFSTITFTLGSQQTKQPLGGSTFVKFSVTIVPIQVARHA